MKPTVTKSPVKQPTIIAEGASLEAFRQIEAICTRFEQTDPKQRDIHTFLEGVQDEQRQWLLRELVLLDLELRQGQGDTPLESDYRLADPADDDTAVEAFREGSRVADPGAKETPPQLPARYQLIETIGRGGIGIVWRAHDRHAQRPVAIKLLQDNFRGQAAANDRLKREALLTGVLQHPGIPPLYEHGVLPDGSAFLVMKLVEGETFDPLRGSDEHPSPLAAERLAIFEQIAQTVGYAHSQGVIHRDLKPSNVMVGRFGEVQLMDWGMASVSGTEQRAGPAGSRSDAATHSSPHLTSAGDVLGTPGYMSPEQARGDVALLDARSDVFALGAILFEVLVGCRLYRGNLASSVLVQAAAGVDPASLQLLREPELEPELAELCAACLQSNPDLRPADGGAVAAIVSDHLSSVAERLRRAELERSAALIRSTEEVKRRRAIAWMATAVAAVSLLGVSGVAWQWRDAVHATQLATEARQLADERLIQAQQVVDDYLTEIAQEDGVLAQSPGTQSLRRSLLEKARDYYAQFLAASQGDAAVSYQSGQAHLRLGRIVQILDPGSEEVFQLFHTAAELFQSLSEKGSDPLRRVEKPNESGSPPKGQTPFRIGSQPWVESEPQDIQAARGLADAYDAIGNAYESASLFVESEQAYALAAGVLETLLTARDDDSLLLAYAAVTGRIALAQGHQGQKLEAEQRYLDALALASPVLERHPDQVEVLQETATIHSNLGVHYGFKLGDWKKSLEYGESGAVLRARLVELEPDKHRHQNALAGSYNNIALALYHNRRVDDSRATFQRAAEIRERLVRENPAIPNYVEKLGNVYNNLGTLSAKQGQADAAMANWQKAIALKRPLAANHPQVLLYAIDCIDLLISIAAVQPDHPRIPALLAEVQTLYEGLLVQRPGSLEFATNLALFRALLLLERFGDEKTRAEKAFRAAAKSLIELTDDVTGAENAGARAVAIRALVLLWNDRTDEASRLLEPVDPGRRPQLVWLTQSLIHCRLEQFQPARQLLDETEASLAKRAVPPDYELTILMREIERHLAEHARLGRTSLH